MMEYSGTSMFMYVADSIWATFGIVTQHMALAVVSNVEKLNWGTLRMLLCEVLRV